MAVIDRIVDIVTPLVAEAGVELYDAEYNGGVVRILIDRDGGVGLDAIRTVTKAVSRAFDEHDPVSGSYTLEVSSPGLERPLRTAAHFRAAVGSDVKIKTQPNYDGDRRIDGVVAAADSSAVEVRTAAGTTVRIAFDDISRARTVFEWGPTPKPGGKPSKKKETSQ